MTKVQENQNASGTYSKFWRIALVLISVPIVFAGPTYLPYLMSKAHVGDFCVCRRRRRTFYHRHRNGMVPCKQEDYRMFASDTLGCIIKSAF